MAACSPLRRRGRARIVYVDTERCAIVGETQLMDSCGVTGVSQSGFAMSSGMGVLQTDQPDHTHLTTATFPGRSFDNHLRIITLGDGSRRMRCRSDEVGATGLTAARRSGGTRRGARARWRHRDRVTPLIKPQTIAISR